MILALLGQILKSLLGATRQVSEAREILSSLSGERALPEQARSFIERFVGAHERIAEAAELLAVSHGKIVDLLIEVFAQFAGVNSAVKQSESILKDLRELAEAHGIDMSQVVVQHQKTKTATGDEIVH